MAQRSIEILIGRLVTDEAFRAMFVRDPAATLARFIECGYELTSPEIAALEATDATLWLAPRNRSTHVFRRRA